VLESTSKVKRKGAKNGKEEDAKRKERKIDGEPDPMISMFLDQLFFASFPFPLRLCA
jgi:hypothetical protein